MAISTPMLVTFCVYIFGMILIGFIAWRSTKNFDDYILGGRSLGPFCDGIYRRARVGYERLAVNGVAGRGFSFRDFRSWIAHWPDIRRVDQLEAVAGRLRAQTQRQQ